MYDSLKRHVIVLAVLCLAGCAETVPPVRPVQPNGPVVVAIVVDQLAAWVAAERLPELPDVTARQSRPVTAEGEKSTDAGPVTR